MRKVVLITGPPCSGKTTLARTLAASQPGIVLDRDDLTRIHGTHAERAMKAEIDRIAQTQDVTAYIIRSLPNPHDREQLAHHLGATHQHLDPGRDECIRRAKHDHRPRWTYKAIDNWYERAQRPLKPARKVRQRTTIQRGYGYRHRRLRASIKPHVDAGQATCWRCGTRIHPGTPWDLGHDDHDRTVYRGPEHVACNRATAAARGNRQRTATTSRDWLE